MIHMISVFVYRGRRVRLGHHAGVSLCWHAHALKRRKKGKGRFVERRPIGFVVGNLWVPYKAPN